MSEQIFDVLILGAGAAGIAAARELSRSGVKTIVVEARDRIGGRVYTKHNRTSPVPIELGAEFVHGRPKELLSIIDEAELKIEEVTSRHWFFEDGQLIRSGEFWAKVEKLMSQMRLDQPDMSFADYLATLPDDEETTRAKEIAKRYVEGFHAATLDRIGVHGLIKANEAEDEIDGDKAYRVADGYAGVIDWLWDQAEQNGATLRLNAHVNELRWHEQHVEAATDVGEITATQVVITVPIPLLSDFPFNPPLPENISSALKSIPMGDVVRLVVEFERRFWADLNVAGMTNKEDLSGLGFIHYPDAALPTWWTLYPDPSAVLIGWAGGLRATAMPTGRDELIHQALNSVADIFQCSYDQVQRELREFHFHDWRNDNLTRGGYAYLGVNGLAAQEILAHPVADTIFFAGEATSVGHIGTVHGAIASGLRAAKQIINWRLQ